MTTKPIAATDIAWGSPHESHVFTRLGEGHYRLEVPEASAMFNVDRLWRDRQRELCGEIVVTCTLKGVKGFDGNLFSGHINLSDAYRRRDVCLRLRNRANTGTQVDWDGLVDELSVRIVRAERNGNPSKLLHTFERPKPDDTFNLEGIILPKLHPSILYGDGGTAKSMMSLYLAGCLSQNGVRVLFADWELEGSDHRDRLERLFGPTMPEVFYHRCYRPLIHEIDGLKREIHERGIQYIICDSVGYATDGAPESAEAAIGYFRAVRQFGIGSLHLAHVTKPAQDVGKSAADPSKPFGSVFWHNSARSTWFIKRTTEGVDDNSIVVAFFNKKNNLGRLHPSVGVQLDFSSDHIGIQRVDLADVDEMAGALPIWQRMRRALEDGPQTLSTLADELGAVDGAAREKLIANMDREARRRKKTFMKLTDTPDGVQRIALVSNRTAA